MKELTIFSPVYTVFCLSLVITCYFYYTNMYIHQLPNHIVLAAAQIYFLTSGYHTIQIIIKAKTGPEKLYVTLARLMKFIPIFVMLIPMKVILLRHFETSSSSSSSSSPVVSEFSEASTRYVFIYRLFSALATFMWITTMELQATILLSFLAAFNSESSLFNWISYITICLYIQYVVDPNATDLYLMGQRLSDRNLNAATSAPLPQEILLYMPNLFASEPLLLPAHPSPPSPENVSSFSSLNLSTSTSTLPSSSSSYQLISPHQKMMVYIEKKIVPLHCQLPYFFLGALLSYILLSLKKKVKNSPNTSSPKITSRQKRSRSLTRIQTFQQLFYSFAMIASLLWLYGSIFHYFWLIQYLPNYEISESIISMCNCIAIMYLFFCIRCSKTIPCYNHFLYDLLARCRLHLNPSLSATISIYFVISHFIICMEYVFFFRFKDGDRSSTDDSFEGTAITCTYCILLSYVLSSILQEWVLKPLVWLTSLAGKACLQAVVNMMNSKVVIYWREVIWAYLNTE